MNSPLRPFHSLTAAALAFSVLVGPTTLVLGAAETTSKEKAPVAAVAPKAVPVPKAASKATTRGANVQAQEKKLTPPPAEPKKDSGAAKKTESSAGLAPQVTQKKAGKAPGIMADDDWEEPVKGAKSTGAPKAAPESVAPKAPAPIAPKAAPKKGFSGTILEGSNI